jgi:phospholipid/cholesterol/gamma-HCH transport system permease protein
MEYNQLVPSLLSPIAFLGTLGLRFLAFVEMLGGLVKLSLQSSLCLFRYKPQVREIIRQFAMIGNRSLIIVVLIALFTGMVIALQLSVGLGRFGLKLYIGQIVGLAIFRELGPVLTCLMIAARVGSGIAAEMGSMVVTEQVLAIEAMGANPIHKLVVPRLVATFIAAPLLTTIADAVGVLGVMIITVVEAGVTTDFYINQITNTVLLRDYMSGIFKTLFFGYFIAIIACYQGLQTSGGTEGVGKATTKAVVHSSIMVFISDFFLTKIFLYF